MSENRDSDNMEPGQQQSEQSEIQEPASDSAATELSQVERLGAELKESQNKYLYLYAEFENYKKRAIRERSDLLKFGTENILRELLQVSDNLERALIHADNSNALVDGLKMVEKQFKDTLYRFGVELIKSIGTRFDPNLHEAVAQQPVEDAAQEGLVLSEHQKGFLLHGRLLRPARVVVAVKSEK
jgi:molecular chaperone GrpE